MFKRNRSKFSIKRVELSKFVNSLISSFAEQRPTIMLPEDRKIFPTFSRGRIPKILFTERHSYALRHAGPVRKEIEYYPKGFGIAEQKYLPLTHIQNRVRWISPAPSTEPSRQKKMYEYALDEIKRKQDENAQRRAFLERRKNERKELEVNYRNMVDTLHYRVHNLQNSTDEMIGDSKYRTHLINKILRDHSDYMRTTK